MLFNETVYQRTREISPGIGVTSPTHVDDGRGLRTGTGTITRLRSPATCAYTSIICRYVTTSTPPISNTLPCVGIAENPDQVGERDKPWEATRPGALDRLCG